MPKSTSSPAADFERGGAADGQVHSVGEGMQRMPGGVLAIENFPRAGEPFRAGARPPSMNRAGGLNGFATMEGGQQRGQPAVRGKGVGIGADDDVRPRAGETQVARGGRTAHRLMQQQRAVRPDNFSGAVGRTVVHHDDFKLSRHARLGLEREQQFAKGRLTVEHRNDDAG
jgi:hypothetical protein